MEMMNLNVKRKSWETYRKNIMEGIIIRSRAQWIKEGEKVTKYFCNLEKGTLLLSECQC